MKKKSIMILSAILVGVISLFCFLKEDENNLETKENEVIATNKNTSLAFTVNGKETDIAFPKKDTGYLGEKVECTNNVEALWNNETWKLEIRNISTTTNCKINFIEYNPYLYSKILEDNPNVSERTSFNEIFTESNNGNTIYKATGEGGADTYYFAGNVTNNYVKFGTDASGNELYWRIVRINEDNSVRLIYAGTSATDTAAFISTSQAFNANYNMSYYVGYEYAVNQQHGLGTNSDIKDTIDTWYTNNLTEEDKYISKTAIYCNDRTVANGYTWSVSGDAFGWGAYSRIKEKESETNPSFACININDQFTASTSIGNGALDSPIALITVDEVTYAGSLVGSANDKYYMVDNTVNYSWWTMTPWYWNNSYYFARNFIVSSTGTVNNQRLSDGTNVRPVLSLKACVQYASGNGTSEKPYEVKLSESCENVENEVLDENVVRVSATTNDSTMASVVAPASVLKNIGDSHTFTLNVNDGYKYKNVEGCTGTYNETDNTLTISSIATSTTCKVNFEEKPQIALYNQILTDNPNRATRSTFNAVYTTSNNGNTIHYATGESGATTYYFAGNVTNNYVKFGTNSSGAALWWRIVRINEDNSVRLIYAGTSATDTAGFISTSQAFNATYDASYYVGYEYSTAQHGTGTNSDIKGVVDTWYTSNLADEGEYLSKTAIYCNDRTVSIASTESWTSVGTSFYYDVYYRLQANYKPVFTCTNASDKFTVSSTTGNGALENPIALITADELAFAGGLAGTGNTSYYIATNASSGANWWWTMSPHNWTKLTRYTFSFVVGGSSSGGTLGSYHVSNANGVRPVTSLKSCVTWENGDGTSDNPYTVSITDECTALEN